MDYARALDKAWRERLQNSGDSCTTHFTVVDREGNLCSVTQTLLSMFGSRTRLAIDRHPAQQRPYVVRPEPGKPNSIGPAKRCLGNYCPILGETPKGERFALGGAGGRKIVGAVLQIASFLIDHGACLEDAFHRPRIDMSGGERVVADIAPARSRAARAAGGVSGGDCKAHHLPRRLRASFGRAALGRHEHGLHGSDVALGRYRFRIRGRSPNSYIKATMLRILLLPCSASLSKRPRNIRPSPSAW